MTKQTYYVSVQANTILEDEGAAAYEFKVNATQEEIDYLQSLINEKMGFDEGTLVRGHMPAIPYHQDKENDNYDDALIRVYKQIYEHGDEAAKQTIASMGLDEIGTLYNN